MAQNLYVGQTDTISLVGLDVSGNQVPLVPDAPPTWSNSNSGVASSAVAVDHLSNVVTAIASGTATIRVDLAVSGVPFTASVDENVTTPLHPTGVTVTPVGTFPNVLANTPGGTVLANLAEIGGTGIGVSFALVAGSDANLSISGSQLLVHSSPSFTPGSTPHYGITVNDSSGIPFSEANTARSYTVPAGPSSLTTSSLAIDDNAVAGQVAGTVIANGGTPPGTFVKSSGTTKFDVNASTGAITRNSTGTLTPGVDETLAISYTDAAGLSVGPTTFNITIRNHTASGLVAQIIVANDAGSPAPSGSVSFTFDHKFAAGDVIGDIDFKLQDGTLIPFSQTVSARRVLCPTDSSLWISSFRLRMPVAIPAPVTLTCTTTINSPNVTVTSGNTSSIAVGAGIRGANISIQPTGVLSITDGTHFVMTQPAVKSGTAQVLTFIGLLVDIKTNGSGPGTSPLTTASLTAGGLDLKNTVTYQTGGSGVAICSLADAIANPRVDDYKSMDGAAGPNFIFPTVPYKISGVADPLLNGFIETEVLQNASNTLYGVREVIFVCNGFADIAGNNFKAFSSVVTDDGLGNSFDCYAVSGVGATRNLSAATIGNNTFTITSGGAFNGGEYVQAGGSPPSPIVAGNFYWVQKVSNTQVQLSNGSAQGASRIVPVTAGGSWTLKPFPWIVPFGAQSDANPNPRPRYYQGAGSVAADTQLRIIKDPYYLRSTGFYPAFDCEGADYKYTGSTRPLANNSAATYVWGTAAPWNQRGLAGSSPESTGYDTYSGNHFFNQTVDTERLAIMQTFLGCQFGIRLRSGQTSTRGRVIPVNNTTYTNMPPPKPLMAYGTTAGGVGFSPSNAAPSNLSALLPGYDSQDFAHFPAWFVGPLDICGQAYALEWAIDNAQHAMLESSGTTTAAANQYDATHWKPGNTRFTSNPAPGGASVNRYCINMWASLQNGRFDVWRRTAHAQATIRTSSAHPEYPYQQDIENNSIANEKEMIVNMHQATLVQQSEFYAKGPANAICDPWQGPGYYGLGIAPALRNYVAFNPDALVGLRQCLKQLTAFARLMGFPLSTNQEIVIMNDFHFPTGALLPDASLLAGQAINLWWNSGSSTFIWNGFATAGLNLHSGYNWTKSTTSFPDYFVFTQQTTAENILVPGGASQATKYYVNPITSSTCTLHLQPDFSDAPFVPTDTYNATSATFFRIQNYAAKVAFPSTNNVNGQFWNTCWDAVAEAVASGLGGDADATGLAMYVAAHDTAVATGLLNQTAVGLGSNYLNTTL